MSEQSDDDDDDLTDERVPYAPARTRQLLDGLCTGAADYHHRPHVVLAEPVGDGWRFSIVEDPR